MPPACGSTLMLHSPHHMAAHKSTIVRCLVVCKPVLLFVARFTHCVCADSFTARTSWQCAVVLGARFSEGLSTRPRSARRPASRPTFPAPSTGCTCGRGRGTRRGLSQQQERGARTGKGGVEGREEGRENRAELQARVPRPTRRPGKRRCPRCLLPPPPRSGSPQPSTSRAIMSQQLHT